MELFPACTRAPGSLGGAAWIFEQHRSGGTVSLFLSGTLSPDIRLEGGLSSGQELRESTWETVTMTFDKKWAKLREHRGMTRRRRRRKSFSLPPVTEDLSETSETPTRLQQLRRSGRALDGLLAWGDRRLETDPMENNVANAALTGAHPHKKRLGFYSREVAQVWLRTVGSSSGRDGTTRLDSLPVHKKTLFFHFVPAADFSQADKQCCCWCCCCCCGNTTGSDLGYAARRQSVMILFDKESIRNRFSLGSLLLFSFVPQPNLSPLWCHRLATAHPPTPLPGVGSAPCFCALSKHAAKASPS